MKLPDDIEEKLADGRRLRSTTRELAHRRGITLNEARDLVRRWLCSTGNKQGKGEPMTADEFADQIELVIQQARVGGLSDEVIIAGLEAAAEALDEGLP
jgi:hypothetical protein